MQKIHLALLEEQTAEREFALKKKVEQLQVKAEKEIVNVIVKPQESKSYFNIGKTSNTYNIEVKIGENKQISGHKKGEKSSFVRECEETLGKREVKNVVPAKTARLNTEEQASANTASQSAYRSPRLVE